ncbi:hypothetical protein PP749_gp097 [Rhizobium phage RHEph22]|uniref:Uncharacterized protein n=1 Tax=Rhizobium phage RHEph22 TaxID=2836135 RepID=A0AAE8AY79_9CAUD|nr:hypothetical protein PP749_gp097 [Rhizobium phage RHEph22]QXV74768.1 hypothetical protein [Rhizobium phage RHEph22]QXV74864.1 hypothetical protein [Rhizobium phage RHEph24]
MTDYFREMMMQIPAPGSMEGDLEVLYRIVGDVESLYERPSRHRDKVYTLRHTDFLPFLRAIRQLAKEHKQLSNELVALSNRVIGEPNDS